MFYNVTSGLENNKLNTLKEDKIENSIEHYCLTIFKLQLSMLIILLQTCKSEFTFQNLWD
jgi:hypothetical protein